MLCDAGAVFIDVSCQIKACVHQHGAGIDGAGLLVLIVRFGVEAAQALLDAAEDIVRFAECEGLDAHAESIRVRARKESSVRGEPSKREEPSKRGEVSE